MNTINDRIALLIKDLGITRSSFADRIRVSRPFVSELCSGVKQPSDRTIADIAREFGVSLAWLEDGEGEMYVKRSANEELALLVSNIMSDADDSFRKRFITLLMALPPEDWGKIERFIDELQKSDSAKSTEDG
jgi:transcriptional regulator with XRE-family HTH domain